MRAVAGNRDAVDENAWGARRPCALPRPATGLAYIHFAVAVADLALDLSLDSDVVDEDLRAAVHAVCLVQVIRDVQVRPATRTYGRDKLDISHWQPFRRELSDSAYIVSSGVPGTRTASGQPQCDYVWPLVPLIESLLPLQPVKAAVEADAVVAGHHTSTVRTPPFRLLSLEEGLDAPFLFVQFPLGLDAVPPIRAFLNDGRGC